MTPTDEGIIRVTQPIARLPIGALLVMTLSTFALIATEAMPAGVLPQIATGMGISEGTAGQSWAHLIDRG